jgi:hypothetical protein
MLIIPNARPVKNPKWAGNITPNTEYDSSPQYRTIADNFGKKAEAKGPYKFKEVRPVSLRSVLTLDESARWWNDPEWMDKVFWVYNKPISFLENGRWYQTYLLEFFESQRVLEGAFRKFGKNIFDDPFPCLLIPCDVVQVCMWEFAAGVSEHKRESIAPVPTQQEIEKEAQIQEHVKELEKNIVDISETPWAGDETKGAI